MIIFCIFQMYAFGVAGERLTMRLRDLTFAAMLKQEISYFDSECATVYCYALGYQGTQLFEK
jgi:hypothetical protein